MLPSPEAGSHDRSPACPPGSVPPVAQVVPPTLAGTTSPQLIPQPRPGRNGARRGSPWPQGKRAWARAICQVLIAFLGGAAILLVSREEPLRSWGFLLGLASQPFWLVATWQARQWGMFALSLWYCLGWAAGVWRHWPWA